MIRLQTCSVLERSPSPPREANKANKAATAGVERRTTHYNNLRRVHLNWYSHFFGLRLLVSGCCCYCGLARYNRIVKLIWPNKEQSYGTQFCEYMGSNTIIYNLLSAPRTLAELLPHQVELMRSIQIRLMIWWQRDKQENVHIATFSKRILSPLHNSIPPDY